MAVFCGPSLPPEDRIADPRIAYLPPAARGDVARAADAFAAVLLIDGVFHQTLAPTPHECRAAAQRTAAFGAASMGALRATECARHGFVPLGAIARWYACGRIDGDDEVAVLTGPTDERALTVPSVNVRFVAHVAVRRGRLDPAAAQAWIARARDIYYAERTWPAVLGLAEASQRGFLARLAERCDLKRADARFALRSVLRRLDRTRVRIRSHPAVIDGRDGA